MNELFLDESTQLLNPRRRDLEPVPGSRGFTPFTVKGIDSATRTVRALVSTPNVDRYEEVIVPEAFEKHLDGFMNNPVMLAAHSHGGQDGSPSVIGQWIDMKVTKDGLFGVGKFLKDDPSGLA